jgi:hypothetical protein
VFIRRFDGVLHESVTSSICISSNVAYLFGSHRLIIRVLQRETFIPFRVFEICFIYLCVDI